ncbi:hypothetical protein GR160_03975 [Flavobacterium sp. Sd200]|uniref:sensor histidine kinase n=1 Tax=Flavobacterium sp. Sd200 TaxID=2692211 RepID=UPI00136F08DB|nr:sensor histidine kinase [Flavobacterium sp. Sd200]MXN90374.1 hypothetical protein [Flavobacterium sp. Sd200]
MKVKTIMILAIERCGGLKIMNIDYLANLYWLYSYYRSNLLILIISCIILLTIILALIVSYRKLKSHNEKITDMQQLEMDIKEKALQLAAHEKDWLLKEIHHRVKNNLQVISSLLNLQSGYLTNDAAQKAIAESQQRIFAISLIHHHSLGTNGILHVTMPAYLNELVKHLVQSYKTDKNITVNVDADDIQMDVSYAMPVGLIVNEAVTNVLKHAYPNKNEGIVTITLKQLGDENYVLSVTDDGIGLNQNAINSNNSLGLTLIKGLSSDIEGELDLQNSNGTAISIYFNYCLPVDYTEIS